MTDVLLFDGHSGSKRLSAFEFDLFAGFVVRVTGCGAFVGELCFSFGPGCRYRGSVWGVILSSSGENKCWAELAEGMRALEDLSWLIGETAKLTCRSTVPMNGNAHCLLEARCAGIGGYIQ